MRILRLFDPWKNELCTCPPKYTLNPYTGCTHQCLYCYISSFIPHAFELREKSPFLHLLARDLEERDPRLYLSLSNSSDPYPPLEGEKQLTRKILSLCAEKDMPVLILTKSSLVVRDADLLSSMKAVVSITITTPDDAKARVLEPHAPSPKERIKAIVELGRRGVPVVLRIDPIIPGITDSFREWYPVLEKVAPFLKQVVVSTLKLRPDTWRRMIFAFPEICHLHHLYSERRKNSLYLSRKIRSGLLAEMRDLVHAFGLPLSTCRENLSEYNDLTCDGSFFLNRGGS